jgi:hypothetical protein
MGARLASGLMLTEAPRKGELWTVLVVRQYLIFFLRGRVKVRGAVLKKVLCRNLQQFNLESKLSSVHIFMDFFRADLMVLDDGSSSLQIYGLEIEQKKLEEDTVVCLMSGEIVRMTMQMNLIF